MQSSKSLLVDKEEEEEEGDEKKKNEESCLFGAQCSPQIFQELKCQLRNPSLEMEKRYRCVFTLRSLGSEEAVDVLIDAFLQENHSDLLKHEIAYVLGQMRQPMAIPFLCNVLCCEEENFMVRHEAAEALGAIGDKQSLPLLEKYTNDPIREIAETCQIAVDRIRYFQNLPFDERESLSSLYDSIDPAPSYSSPLTTEKLKEKLLDSSLSLFERYRALFSLRDRRDKESVEAMVLALNDSSALMRHEVAFALGQVQHSESVAPLAKILANESENPMVRHEAAEALGAIGTTETLPLLKRFSIDTEMVVKESCEVALDIHRYFNSEEFQYADGLLRGQQ